jgi:hypothetical protein
MPRSTPTFHEGAAASCRDRRRRSMRERRRRAGAAFENRACRRGARYYGAGLGGGSPVSVGPGLGMGLGSGVGGAGGSGFGPGVIWAASDCTSGVCEPHATIDTAPIAQQPAKSHASLILRNMTLPSLRLGRSWLPAAHRKSKQAVGQAYLHEMIDECGSRLRSFGASIAAFAAHASSTRIPRLREAILSALGGTATALRDHSLQLLRHRR